MQKPIVVLWKVLQRSADKNKSSTLIFLGKFIIHLGKVTYSFPQIFSHNTYDLGYKTKFVFFLIGINWNYFY